MFKLLYLLSPLVSVIVAGLGYPMQYVVVGIACSMAMITLDTMMVALRLGGFTGVGGAIQFMGGMTLPLLAMLLPATLWNFAGFGLGWIASMLFM